MIFNQIRPWVTTRQRTNFYQHISKITTCRLNIRKRDKQVDRQSSDIELIDIGKGGCNSNLICSHITSGVGYKKEPMVLATNAHPTFIPRICQQLSQLAFRLENQRRVPFSSYTVS